MTFQFENIICSFAPGFLHHEECELFKDAIVSILIRCGKSRFGDWFSAHAKVISFRLMSFKSNYYIAKAFTIAELTEHECKQLIPTSKMFDILVSLILANYIVESASIQIGSQL